jgi:hypothetical protein
MERTLHRFIEAKLQKPPIYWSEQSHYPGGIGDTMARKCQDAIMIVMPGDLHQNLC